MNKPCARCEKTVYPIEELKCLDKIWHKTCFKCNECGMILNMKNYKGFNKMPYCNAHTPQARATTVVDTPETRRLAENTKIQSQVKYHAEFEKQKGKLTQVADDPETLRIRNTSKIISNAAYHGEYEKKKQMEERRNMLDNESANLYNNNAAPAAAVLMKNNSQPLYHPTTANHQQQPQQQPQPQIQLYNNNYQPKSTHLNHATNNNNNKVPNVDYVPHNYVDNEQKYRMQLQQQQQLQQRVAYHQQPTQLNYPEVISYDQAMYQRQQQHAMAMNQPKAVSIQALGRCVRAIYDYTAQDVDEVTFIDGDIIVNCQAIDDGWMRGTVQRTGLSGMLPSNYVENVN